MFLMRSSLSPILAPSSVVTAPVSTSMRATLPFTTITLTPSGIPAPTAGNTKSQLVFMLGFSFNRPSLTASSSVMPIWIWPSPSSLSVRSLRVSWPVPLGGLGPFCARSSPLLQAYTIAANAIVIANSSSLAAARPMIAPRWVSRTASSRSDLMISLLITVDRLVDHVRCNFALLPAQDLNASALEVLVDMEEMLHFTQIMLRKIRDVEELVVVRVVTRHRKNFVIRLAAIQHLEHAQRPAIDLAAGERRLVDVHENVEWITVVVQSSRDKPVIAGIVHRRVQHAIEPNHSGRLVELILVATTSGNFDDRRDVVRGMKAW